MSQNLSGMKWDNRLQLLNRTSQICTCCKKSKRKMRFYDRETETVNDQCNKCSEHSAIMDAIFEAINESGGIDSL